MDNRREFLKKATLLSAGTGLLNVLPSSIARAMAIDPAAGSTFFDAEHVVLLMQENRSFDHTYGTLQGVRGYNDPRAINLPDKKPVWYQTNGNGETFAPFRLDIKNTNATWMESLPHAWSDQVDARNEGKYDRWLDSKRSHIEEYRNMPLTLGCYTRDDIPFYYSLADAFTVCDQHFCSSLTGTTPNRLYFWTGTIREKPVPQVLARVWNEDADGDTPVSWTTFPERLEENNVSWKIYQNEVTIGSGLEGESEAWLANFGDNAIEYFSQFNIRASASQLSGKEKSLHEKAFTKNSGDPHYRELTTLKYQDDGITREVKIPKGDILHQFRQDVQNGDLPTVSWLVAPQEFSDHPSSAWYGAWYISEVMDILTKNPEVWKKTIFILTYDENDGYFDHVPPFVAPHPEKTETGKASAGIDTSVEYVSSAAEQTSKPENRRISSIGLGYRVPLVIASPWTRGGWVNSQVFDHTSSLMFLEKFLSHKKGKKIEEPNISRWRRTVCGDLTSVFRTYNGEKLKKPLFLEKNEFIESIHKARFRNVPGNFRKLTQQEVEEVKSGKRLLLPQQEKGIRDANALPYELYVNGHVHEAVIRIDMGTGDKVFGEAAAGSAFHVYAPGKYRGEMVKCRSYAVAAGDTLQDDWMISDFESGEYHLQVYGPNGFFRQFRGSASSAAAEINVAYDMEKNRKMRVLIKLINHSDATAGFTIEDRSYGRPSRNVKVNAGSFVDELMDVTASHGWYDIVIRRMGDILSEWRYAGRVENGRPGKTDPLMGGLV